MGKISSTFAEKLRSLLPAAPKEENPLSNPRSATRWLEQLPLGDALKAHAAILTEIRRFNEHLTEPTKAGLEALMLLDEKAQDLRDVLVRQYLRNARMTRIVESQLWHEVYNLLWETARSYHSLIRSFNQSSDTSWQQPLLPLMTLRLIRNFRLLMKWRSIRYLQLGDKIWFRLHNLYRVAEAGGFNTMPLHVYPTDSQATTCESEYLHCLMLQQAHAGTLYPRQLDLVDRWLGKWAPIFLSLSADLDLNLHTFNIDLSADRGPRRIRNADNEDTYRYWATKQLVAHLDELRESLKNGSAPSEIGLTEDVRTSEAIDLLNHLGRQWSPLMGREQRRQQRQPIKKLVEVAHGLPDIVTCIRHESGEEDGLYTPNLVYDEIVDVHVYGFVTARTKERAPLSSELPNVSGGIESWIMHDESECGYGAIVETKDKDWLRVGTLTAIQTNRDGVWNLGVLRRLSRVNDRESSVGIETFPEQAQAIMLYGKGRRSEGYSVDGIDTVGMDLPVAALQLTSCEPGKVCLIMDAADYQHKGLLEIRRLKERQPIQLGPPLERGEGWIRVNADLLKASGAT
jgi:cyclic-di-GMP-binding protein